MGGERTAPVLRLYERKQDAWRDLLPTERCEHSAFSLLSPLLLALLGSRVVCLRVHGFGTRGR